MPRILDIVVTEEARIFLGSCWNILDESTGGEEAAVEEEVRAGDIIDDTELVVRGRAWCCERLRPGLRLLPAWPGLEIFWLRSKL